MFTIATTSPHLDFVASDTSLEMGDRESGPGFRLRRSNGQTTLWMYDDDGFVDHREEFGPDSYDDISELLAFSLGVADAIEFDHEGGVSRNAFRDDTLYLDDLKLSVHFDLICASSNDCNCITVTLIRWSDDLEESLIRTSVDLSIEDLVSAVSHVRGRSGS